MHRLATLALTLGLAGPAAASPCDPLVEGMTGGAWAFAPAEARAAAEACEAAFIADPASQPRLGAGGSNVLGVNHRLGDLSFVLAHGRLPTAADAEVERMRLHLDLALAILSARPATRPELAARRAEILQHLAVYRDKGTVPENLLVARRSPVFIDGADRICAVGYLIEATVGRGLAQAVADRHLIDYLGDMDYAPLAAWVASSGFTVDELALIQPAYSLPPVEDWVTFVGPLRMGVRPPDGPFTVSSGGLTTRGAWQRGHMHGPWRRVDADGVEVGSGTFEAGRGRWSGRYPDGALAIEGEVARDAPNGVWRAYHPSGRLAIEGELRDAVRSGTWSYYHDAPGQPLMARGRYRHTEVGAWEHYDVTGRHIATSDTKAGVVTWYDDAGLAVASEALWTWTMTGTASGVAWRHADGRREVTRVVIAVQSEPAWNGPLGSELELRFDAAGLLTTALLREYRGEDDETLSSTDVLTIAGGRAVEAWSYVPEDPAGTAGARWRLAVEGLDPKLVARLATRAGKSARRHDGGPELAGASGVVAAAAKVFAALSDAARTEVAEVDPAWVDGLRFTQFAPSLAARSPSPPLVAGCGAPEADAWWPGPWACLTEPGAQIQAFARHLPVMITSGTNFLHLDELAARLMWSRMPDRVQPGDGEKDPLPAWYELPPMSEAQAAKNVELFGELSSTHAPLLGRRRR